MTDRNAPGTNEAVASANVVVLNPLGLHTRPATLIAKRALREVTCSLRITCLESGAEAQGNSIISLLSIGAPQPIRGR